MEKQNNSSNDLFKFTKTDTLVFEYVKLPVICTSYRFLYRLKTPFETVWQEDKIYPHKREVVNLDGLYTSGCVHKELEELIEEFALSTWKSMVYNSLDSKQELPKELEWMINIEKTEIHKCEIVRK